MAASEMRLNVLFLTPPAKAGGALAAQSFVEEEIRAIRDVNVQPYVLTDEMRGRTAIDDVPLVGIPRASVANIRCPIWLGMTHMSLVARLWQASRNPREIFHALRLEAAAARHFAATDVFVHAAELEAAGNVILEAQACGAAVVVTDSGGPGEYVEDGVTGFVIPVGDAPALTARLETLLANPSLAGRLAEAARHRVEHRHDYPRMMAAVRGVLRRCPDGRQTVVKSCCPARNSQLTSPTLPRNVPFLRSSDDEQAS